MKALDVVIPVYNEDVTVVREVLADLRRGLAGREGLTVFVVDDGSDPGCGLGSLAREPGIVFLRHEKNRGYGAALKTGIRAGTAEAVAIVDADGSYQAETLGNLAGQTDGFDLVIGARTGPHVVETRLRRTAKKLLNAYASYLAGAAIPDLNSGMRIFTRELAEFLWELLPDAFSFTSTTTMGALLNGFRVTHVPINYRKRIGKSSFHPLKDTALFIKTLFRLGLLFAPLRAAAPFTAFLLALGLGLWIGGDLAGQGTGGWAVFLLLAAIQVLGVGLTAQVMAGNRRRRPGKEGAAEREAEQPRGD
ncbi:MAG: glycosyltransferase family 2 protein [Thermodesulfobacteriota bacterium]